MGIDIGRTGEPTAIDDRHPQRPAASEVVLAPRPLMHVP